jgi:hypothetical protein
LRDKANSREMAVGTRNGDQWSDALRVRGQQGSERQIRSTSAHNFPKSAKGIAAM